MKHDRVDPAAFFTKPSNRLFAAYAARVAILDQPKRSLRGVRNLRRMEQFRDAIQAVVPGA